VYKQQLYMSSAVYNYGIHRDYFNLIFMQTLSFQELQLVYSV